MSKPSDLVQGTLDLLVLKILALEPLHGWLDYRRMEDYAAAELSSGLFVSGNYFEVLGVSPALGRVSYDHVAHGLPCRSKL